MHEVFNMGCGFCVVVAADDEEAALEHAARPTTRAPSGSAVRPRASPVVSRRLRRRQAASA